MEKINLEMFSNLEDKKKQAIARQMLKMILARMKPEERKLFLLNMERMAYRMEIQRKLLKHKRMMKYLTLPLIPITFLTTILQAYKLKKIYTKQALVLAQNLKKLQGLAQTESESLNLISPERTKGKKSVQEDYST